MDKAILVVDMPDYCSECILCRKDYFGHDICIAVVEHIFAPARPEWCPLKPVPEPKLIWHDDDRDDWERGYNECLSEIVGDDVDG